MRADGLSIFRLWHPKENDMLWVVAGRMPWVVADRNSGRTLGFFPSWTTALDWTLTTVEAATMPEVCS